MRSQFQSIPSLDFSAFEHGSAADRQRTALRLGEHLRETGFIYVTGHNVPEASIRAVRAANKKFHALPLSKKNAMAIDRNFRGYIPINSSTIVTSSVATVSRPNQSASLMLMHEVPEDDPRVIAGEALQGPNQWPAENDLPGFRNTIEVYVRQMNQLGRQLLNAICLALQLPADYLNHYFAKPTTFLRLLHYPPQRQEEGLFGSAPHTDYGFITLLAQDEVGGLEVRNRAGDWISAPPVENSFIMNVGDILARWTNDLFVSTPHRVLNHSGRERYSQPFFYDPSMDSQIDVLPCCAEADGGKSYAPVRYGDYLMERIDKNYQSRKKTNL